MASPVVTRVSQATRPIESCAKTASKTASEIWSAILSGCPSVTDSEVNRKLRFFWLKRRLLRGAISSYSMAYVTKDEKTRTANVTYGSRAVNAQNRIVNSPM